MRRSSLAILLLLGAYLAGLVGTAWFHDAELVPAAHAEGRDHDASLVPSDREGTATIHDGRGCAACAWEILSRGCLLPAPPRFQGAALTERRARSSGPWFAVATPRLPSARSPPRG